MSDFKISKNKKLVMKLPNLKPLALYRTVVLNCYEAVVRENGKLKMRCERERKENKEVK